MRDFTAKDTYLAVRPNFLRYVGRLRGCTVAAALLLAAGFFCLILAGCFQGFRAVSSALAIAAACTIAPGGILGLATYRRTKLCNGIAAVIEQILGADSTEIEDLKWEGATAEQKEFLVRTLIEKGNLPNYRIEDRARVRRDG